MLTSSESAATAAVASSAASAAWIAASVASCAAVAASLAASRAASVAWLVTSNETETGAAVVKSTSEPVVQISGTTSAKGRQK